MLGNLDTLSSLRDLFITSKLCIQNMRIIHAMFRISSNIWARCPIYIKRI